MRNRTCLKSGLFVAIILTCVSLAGAQTPLGTAFTYQGLLRNGALPASGFFNFQFSLFTAEAGGSQIGSTQTINGVAMDGGVFTVVLDFGEGAFGAEARWLQIAVEPGGGGGFTTLSPRQRIRPVPVSLTAAGTSGSGPVATRNFVVGPGQTAAPNQVVSFLTGTATIRPGFATRLTHFAEEQILNWDPTKLPATTRLTENSFIAAFRIDPLLKPSVRVAMISGPGIAFGPQNNAQVSLGGTQITEYLDVASLTPTRFVIAAGVARGTNGGFGYAWVGTVNPDSSITLGVEQQFQAPSISTDRVKRVRVAQLTDTDFIIAYTFNDNPGRVVVGRVSGSTITFGTPVPFNAAATDYVGIAAMNATDAVVVCRDGGNFNNGTANFIKVTDLVPAIGPDVTFNSAVTNQISIAALDSTRCLVAYGDVGNANFGTAIVGIVGGGSVTFGSEEVFAPTATGFTHVSASTGGSALIGFRNDTAAGAGMAVSANVLGTDLTYSFMSVFNDSSVPELAVIATSDERGAVIFRDGGDQYRGKAAAAFCATDSILGIAKGGGSAGQTIPVQLMMPGSVAGGFGVLFMGFPYYGQADGLISAAGRGVKIGVAISGSEILLTP